MSKERKYRWYIGPENSKTNTALSSILAGENYNDGIPDENGEPRRVWECDYKVVKRFRAERAREGYEFSVFNREGNGKMRLANFPLPRKKSPVATKAQLPHSAEAVS